MWRSLKQIFNLSSVYLYVSLVIVVRSACPESAQLLLHPCICTPFCCAAQQAFTLQAAGNFVQGVCEFGQFLLHNFTDIPGNLLHQLRHTQGADFHDICVSRRVVNNLRLSLPLSSRFFSGLYELTFSLHTLSLCVFLRYFLSSVLWKCMT